MNELSLVDYTKLEKDPRKLAYLFPSMPAWRYKEKTDEYYRQLCLQAVEIVVKMTGCVLMPSTCLHHRRRDPQRRILIFGRTYYVLDPDALTKAEIVKYRAFCEGDETRVQRRRKG